MKKLISLACITLLAAACSAGDWGSCPDNGGCHDTSCCQAREPLSQRSFGSNRGYGHVPLQYNDQDYKGRYHCCSHMQSEAQPMKKMKKKAKPMASIEPAADQAMQKVVEEKPKKRGLFF